MEASKPVHSTLVSEHSVKGQLVYQATKEIEDQGAFDINVVDMGRTVTGHLTGEDQRFKFQLHSSETNELFTQEFSYTEFDALFRFNAELMNPNKRLERFFWVCQRLDFISDGQGGLKLILRKDPSIYEPKVPIFDTTTTIPMTRMSASDRHKIRSSLLNIEVDRMTKIAAVEKRSQEKFQAEVALKKQAAEEKAAVLKIQALKEKEDRENHKHNLFLQEQQHKQHEAVIQAKRDLAIEHKLKLRKEREQQATLKLKKRFHDLDEQQQKQILDWKRKAEIFKLQIEKQKHEQLLHQESVEFKRLSNQAKIKQDWENEKQSWSLRLKAMDDKKLKHAAQLREKKQAMLHDIQLHRTKIYLELKSAREERSQVQAFCAIPMKTLALIEKQKGSVKFIGTNNPTINQIIKYTNQPIELSHTTSTPSEPTSNPRLHGAALELLREQRIKEKETARNLREAEKAQAVKDSKPLAEKENLHLSDIQQKALLNKKRQEQARLDALREQNIARRNIEKLTKTLNSKIAT